MNTLLWNGGSYSGTVDRHRYSACDLEGPDLALMVAMQVEIEAKEAACGSVVPLCHSLEHPVGTDAWIVADCQSLVLGAEFLLYAIAPEVLVRQEME